MELVVVGKDNKEEIVEKLNKFIGTPILFSGFGSIRYISSGEAAKDKTKIITSGSSYMTRERPIDKILKIDISNVINLFTTDMPIPYKIYEGSILEIYDDLLIAHHNPISDKWTTSTFNFTGKSMFDISKISLVEVSEVTIDTLVEKLNIFVGKKSRIVSFTDNLIINTDDNNRVTDIHNDNIFSVTKQKEFGKLIAIEKCDILGAFNITMKYDNKKDKICIDMIYGGDVVEVHENYIVIHRKDSCIINTLYFND